MPEGCFPQIQIQLTETEPQCGWPHNDITGKWLVVITKQITMGTMNRTLLANKY
jgi:hypothetical protein